MEIVVKNKKINHCIRCCPYYATEGMEKLMLCTHFSFKPALKKDSYANAIITYENGHNGFPEKCPIIKKAQSLQVLG